MKFGDNLKAIRKLNNMSQEQLAEKMGVSRQAVSKWENGETYPEMNNILQLCKIFKCNVDDLVNSETGEFPLIDEEVATDAASLNSEKLNQMKTLCHVIELIGKIGGIVLKVAIPFIIIAMLLIPYVVNNVNIQDTLEIGGIVIGELDEEAFQSEVYEMLQSHSKGETIIFAEISLGFLIINIVLTIFILGYVEKLFHNIRNNITPFTLDNVTYIKKVSYLLIALIIIIPLSGGLINGLSGFGSSDSPFGLLNILGILIIFSMSYVFEYGYQLQKNS